MTVTDPTPIPGETQGGTRRRACSVRKRNGDTEPVDVNKIVRAVERCADDLAEVDPLRVATQDHQRPVRRRHHRRTRPAVDPDRGRDDRRGAAVLAARGPPARRLHRQGGARPGHRVLQPVDQPRPRRGADRRRDRARSSRTTRASSTTPSTPDADRRFEYFGLRTVYDRYLLRHPATAAGRSRRRSTSCCGSRAACRGRRPRRSSFYRLMSSPRLPAELADAVQLGHQPSADVVVLPRRLAARRPRLDLRPLRAGRPASQVLRRHRHRAGHASAPAAR